MKPIKVGMAELKVGQKPDVFISIGLGSCIGIVLYDKIMKIGGIAHVMSPSINGARHKSKPARFADSAIDIMIGEMISLGAVKRNIKAKIFGGADMFPDVVTKIFLKVGERNALSVKDELAKRKIRIVSEELGGNSGRTITFDTKNGIVAVTGIGKERKVY